MTSHPLWSYQDDRSHRINVRSGDGGCARGGGGRGGRVKITCCGKDRARGKPRHVEAGGGGGGIGGVEGGAYFLGLACRQSHMGQSPSGRGQGRDAGGRGGVHARKRSKHGA